MGTARSNSRPHPVSETSVWPSDSAGEAAVLAEFADEGPLESSQAPEIAPAAPVRSGLRLFDPQTPLRDVVRTVLIACLTAMALGASFAIGFGYIWNAPSAVAPAVSPEAAAARTDGARTEGARTEGARTEGRDFSPGQIDGTAPAATKVPARRTDSPALHTEPPATRTDVPAVRTKSPRADVPVRGGEARAIRRDAGSTDETSGAALVSTPMLSVAEVPLIEPALAIAPELPPLPSSEFSLPVAVHRTDVEAVRRTIERYESAYSQKDIGTLALVWPTVDVAGVEKAFASVDRQALTLTDCRVTTAGNLATAVCPGQVRYVGRVGGRQLQERQGTWTIALERRGDDWQFTRLNVR